jgi:hypothetical protein
VEPESSSGTRSSLRNERICTDRERDRELRSTSKGGRVLAAFVVADRRHVRADVARDGARAERSLLLSAASRWKSQVDAAPAALAAR